MGCERARLANKFAVDRIVDGTSLQVAHDSTPLVGSRADQFASAPQRSPRNGGATQQRGKRTLEALNERGCLKVQALSSMCVSNDASSSSAGRMRSRSWRSRISVAIGVVIFWCERP